MNGERSELKIAGNRSDDAMTTKPPAAAATFVGHGSAVPTNNAFIILPRGSRGWNLY